MLGVLGIDVPKAKRIQGCNGTRTHRKNIAMDSAHAGSRPLIGFDGGRVVGDSILKAQASPSPMSTKPAFSSPASTKRRFPSLGKVFSHRIEFLYEQCSDHMTEKMLNSVKFGTRPSIFFIRSNSSSDNPSARAVLRLTCNSVVCIGAMSFFQKYKGTIRSNT